jgi:acetoin utilization deacetylase AcuC-like enzyme
VFPRLLEFEPDFILISAGFDAHEKDFLGSSSFISISEFDYSWVTKELVKISNMCCEGRLISMLEGGYNTDGGGLFSPLGNSIYSHIYELSHGNNEIITMPKDEFRTRKRKFEEISNSSLPVIQATYSRYYFI